MKHFLVLSRALSNFLRSVLDGSVVPFELMVKLARMHLILGEFFFLFVGRVFIVIVTVVLVIRTDA